MNLTLHIVQYDLRRMRAWIACWVGVLLVPLLIGAQLLSRSAFDRTDDWNLPNTLAIVVGLQSAVAFVLTILLIHEHRIVGTQQFWLTRPISPRRLLAAKTIGAFLIIYLPAILVSLPWWLWCGFGPGHIAHAAGDLFVCLLIVVVPAALVAVLTDSFARAVLWMIVLVATVAFGVLWFVIANSGSVRSGHGMAMMVSRSVAVVLLIIIEMIVVIGGQFLLRRRGWWLAAAGILILLTVLPGMRRSFPGIPWVPDEPREHHAEQAGRMVVELESAMAASPMRASAASEVFRWVNLQFVVRGAPTEMFVTPYGSRLEWRWPNGVHIGGVEQVNGGYSPSVLGGVRLSEELERTHVDMPRMEGNRRAFQPGEFVVYASSLSRPSLIARMEAEPPAFDARFWWRLLRPELQFELPLAPGGWKAANGHGMRIERLSGSDQGAVLMVETRPVFLSWILEEMASSASIFHRWGVDRGFLAVIDRERDQIVDFPSGREEKSRAVVISGVRVEWNVRSIPPRPRFKDGQPGRLSLALFTLREEAVFSNEVKQARFEFTK